MKILYIMLICMVFLISGLFESCSGSAGIKSQAEKADVSTEEVRQNITFASWNVQTFFDARTTGTEYDDFKKAGNWSKDKYLVRLGRLCDVLTSLNPDVIVLEEIENAEVVQDIVNQLAGKNWNRSKRWEYAFFAKENGSAIGCAVFSRYRISDISVHSMDIRCQQIAQPQCRPVIQFSVESKGRHFWVLANHWKSKLGADESRIWRQWQESVAGDRLCRLLAKSEAVILCGDFNQDIGEFCPGISGDSGSKAKVLFRSGGAGGRKVSEVYSPWLTQGGALSTKTGSYYYQGEWERIDHIFAAGSARIAAFAPRSEEPWADTEGRPIAYRIYNGEGYSDHLPVMCTVTF
ncbi:MAG: endonuclease/exonuclease/phosphatase family protein [Treponema sp.]|nr:endonuclease/exonuclease/phosphatase family protein [Treponema sp.]